MMYEKDATCLHDARINDKRKNTRRTIFKFFFSRDCLTVVIGVSMLMSVS